MSKLQGAQIEKIYNALLSGYADKDDLERMVQFKLNENLDVIVGGDNLGEIVLDLIQWAIARGRLRELVFAAHQHHPGNVDIKMVAENFDQWQLATPPPTETLDTFQAEQQPIAQPTDRYRERRQELLDFLHNATSS